MQMNFENLQSHLASIFDVEPAILQPNAIFSELDQWDSFAILSIVALVTEHTGTQITVREVEKLVCVQDLATLLNEFL
jgi:acyl carrier protein